MTESKLPIDEMFKEKFGKLRKKLNADFLNEELFTELSLQYKLVPGEIKVNCDEAHACGYSCAVYPSRHTAVFARMLLEIRNYRSVLKKGINELDKRFKLRD